VSGEVGTLPPVVEIAAYRIATEALTNVARHAGVHTARVLLTTSREALVLTVTDDGRWADEEAASAGTGLRSMRERADELDGSLSIAALPEGGTEVRAVLPTGVDA
jgi:signal transduction histidine kinase